MADKCFFWKKREMQKKGTFKGEGVYGRLALYVLYIPRIKAKIRIPVKITRSASPAHGQDCFISSFRFTDSCSECEYNFEKKNDPDPTSKKP